MSNVGEDEPLPNTYAPSLPWRCASSSTYIGVAALCRGFLYGLNKTEVHGLPAFLELLRSRADPSARQRGLLTVSNHVSVMDDPLIWGVIPLSHHLAHGTANQRWGFGSHDICFTSAFRRHFFTLGQVLPTHRSAHSIYGGPFQPSIREAIRVLSPIHPFSARSAWSMSRKPCISSKTQQPFSDRHPSWPHEPIDPFSDLSIAPHFPSHPHEDSESYLAPSRYASNNLGWVHIFPEGMIHQSSTYNMRYFKWGVARLILEPPIAPDFVPVWIEGTDQIMHESREFPRFIPRAGKNVSVTFGTAVDTERRFGDLRARWVALQKRDVTTPKTGADSETTQLEHAINIGWPQIQGQEAEVEALWIETALRVRQEVLKLRRARGWPDEDPKASAAATWKKEGSKEEGKMEDGSWVGQP